MLNEFLLMDCNIDFTYFSFFTWYLNINECCKEKKLIKESTVLVLSLDGYMHMLIPFSVSVCYLREKSAPLTNFHPNWTTRSKVMDFFHFICRVS